MAKPIFIIKIPSYVDQATTQDLIEAINNKPLFVELRKEYYTLPVLTQSDDFEFEVLNSDKADEVTMEKVKEIELLITKNINDEESGN